MAGGRPTDYDPEIHPTLAEELARQGLTQSEIADELGLNACTITDWKNKYPEFSKAIKRGKQTPDDKVEKSLYTRAIGYECTETKTVKDSNGKAIKTETITRQIIPDVGAQCMWLKNRRPDKWRDKVQQEISGPEGKPLVVKVLKGVDIDDLR